MKHLADAMWTCPCRSLSDHPASLVESVLFYGKQISADAKRLPARGLVHVTFAEAPQQHHHDLLSTLHSKCSSRSVASFVVAHVPSKWHNLTVRLNDFRAQPFGFHHQHHTRGYKSLISSAAHQLLGRLSQRSEELCQRLSGWRYAFCVLVSVCLPHNAVKFEMHGAARQTVRYTGEGAGALGQQELTSLNVELGESTPVVEAYRSLRSLQAELQDLQSFANGPDEDMRQLAVEEEPTLLAQVLKDAIHAVAIKRN